MQECRAPPHHLGRNQAHHHETLGKAASACGSATRATPAALAMSGAIAGFPREQGTVWGTAEGAARPVYRGCA